MNAAKDRVFLKCISSWGLSSGRPSNCFCAWPRVLWVVHSCKLLELTLCYVVAFGQLPVVILFPGSFHCQVRADAYAMLSNQDCSFSSVAFITFKQILFAEFRSALLLWHMSHRLHMDHLPSQRTDILTSFPLLPTLNSQQRFPL